MKRVIACLCCSALAACISITPEPQFDPGTDPGVSEAIQPDADASGPPDVKEAEIATDPGTVADTPDPTVPDIVEYPDHDEIPMCVADPGCDDGNPCTDDLRCPPNGACEHVFNEAPCSEGRCDGPILFPAARCKAGTCVPSKPVDCDDANPCTTDACAPAGCTHASVAGYCDDGNGCTSGDLCTGGNCSGAPLASCACTGKPADHCAKFDDGNRCNGTLTCRPDSGMCVIDPATVIQCTLAEGLSLQCAVPACDPETGACSAKPRPGATTCDDGNACTSGDYCVEGVCTPGAANVCEDAVTIEPDDAFDSIGSDILPEVEGGDVAPTDTPVDADSQDEIPDAAGTEPVADPGGVDGPATS
jgi:hypothetical protein